MKYSIILDLVSFQDTTSFHEYLDRELKISERLGYSYGKNLDAFYDALGTLHSDEYDFSIKNRDTAPENMREYFDDFIFLLQELSESQQVSIAETFEE